MPLTSSLVGPSKPSNFAADRLVPPQQHCSCVTPLTSAPIKTPGDHAIIDTSGMSRAASFGTPGPACHAGLAKIWLAPPPLDPQPLSIPPGATPTTLMSLPEASHCGVNVVPPTAVTCGLAAISLGVRVVPAAQA